MTVHSFTNPASSRAAFQTVATAYSTGVSPPSGALINVILEYADVRHAVGGDRSILSVSDARQCDPAIRRLLGSETERLGDVSVLWDEQESEIIRVHDAADLGPRNRYAQVWASELDTFELTEFAMDYLSRHQCHE